MTFKHSWRSGPLMTICVSSASVAGMCEIKLNASLVGPFIERLRCELRTVFYRD